MRVRNLAHFINVENIMNPWRGLGKLPREIWVLSIVTLINRMGTMVLPFLVLYLTRSLGFSVARAGLIITIYGIGAIIAGPISGWLSDRIGALAIMVASLLLSGICLILFPLAQSFATVAAITFVWAVINEAYRPANLAFTAELAQPHDRKAAFALTRLAINLGMSFGPAVGGFLATYSFTSIFYVDAATSLLAGILLFFANLGARIARTERVESASAGPSPLGNIGVMADTRLRYFMLAMLPVIIVFFQHEASMPLFLVQDLSLSESTFGLLFTLNTVIIIAIEVPLNTAMAHWQHKHTLMLGSLLIGLGFGGLAFVNGLTGVAATVVVWTFGEMILLPGMSAYMADIAPPARRGEYMGLYTMAFSVAFAVGPWLGNYVYELFGPLTLWIGTLIFGCLSALMMLRVRTTETE